MDQTGPTLNGHENDIKDSVAILLKTYRNQQRRNLEKEHIYVHFNGKIKLCFLMSHGTIEN
jgi:hypothetical protein